MVDRTTPGGDARNTAVAPSTRVPRQRSAGVTQLVRDPDTGRVRVVLDTPTDRFPAAHAATATTTDAASATSTDTATDAVTESFPRVAPPLDPDGTGSGAERTGRHRPPAPRASRWETAVVGIVLAALSWMVATWPFRGDQAVFALLGGQIVDGQTMYTQIWDVKQPGVFLWYGLFGFGELGMRLLDVAMAFAFGACVWALLRRRTESARLRRLLPALATAVLLLGAGPGDFGQLEMLCLVPAVGAFALVAAHPDREPAYRRIVLAGLCVGVIGVFKLLLAGVAGVALLVYLVVALRRGRVGACVVLTAAAFVPVLAVLGWLASQGALNAALHVWTVEAAQMGQAPGTRSVGRYAEGLGRYVAWMFPVAVLAVWQAATAWRRRDALDLAMTAFLLADAVAIALQFAWWYQWYFASAPLVVLALRRLDRLSRKQFVVAAVLCLPLLAHAAAWAVPTVLDGGGFTAASRERIDERVAGYTTIRTEIAAAELRPTDRLYVLGDPLYNRLSGTDQPLRFDGWTYDLMSDLQWQELATEIDTGRPDVLLVSTDADTYLRARGPQVVAVLDRDYAPYRTSPQGTWYRIR